MKCPHCTDGKVVLFTSVEACEKCGGSGLDPEITQGCLNPCGEIVLSHRYEMSLEDTERFHKALQRKNYRFAQLYNGAITLDLKINPELEDQFRRLAKRLYKEETNE